MNKEELRKKYRIIRDNISSKEEKSKQIINNLISTKEYQNSKVIALYYSIKSEVRTEKLIEISLQAKKIVLLPKVEKNNLMNFYPIKSLNDVQNGTFNIKEPISKEIIGKEKIDLMIIPGICFDKNRNRIGYGKGYYDRYLKETNIKKIGICYEEQITDNISPDSTDISLDNLITERNIY